MNRLKRTLFFWLEQLQITRKERITVTALLSLILILLLINTFLQDRYNYSQEQYDEIMAEFNARNSAIEQERIQNEKKYLPQPASIPLPAGTPQITEQIPESGVMETDEVVQSTGRSVINMNTATITELITLPGIGPVYAQRILDYRQEYGNFEVVEDLLKIKGIGKKTLEKLKPFIEL